MQRPNIKIHTEQVTQKKNYWLNALARANETQIKGIGFIILCVVIFVVIPFLVKH